MKKSCRICLNHIEGQAFTLSNLAEPPAIIEVCATCAAAGDITLQIDGTSVTLDRDDYLQCDVDALEMALGEAWSALDDSGWILDGLSLRRRK